MEIHSELAKIKNKIETVDEIEEVMEVGDIELKVYTKNNHLVFEIPDTNGNPHSPEIRRVQKAVIMVFGVTMLPNPNTGSVTGSVKIEEI